MKLIMDLTVIYASAVWELKTIKQSSPHNPTSSANYSPILLQRSSLHIFLTVIPSHPTHWLHSAIFKALDFNYNNKQVFVHTKYNWMKLIHSFIFITDSSYFILLILSLIYIRYKLKKDFLTAKKTET